MSETSGSWIHAVVAVSIRRPGSVLALWAVCSIVALGGVVRLGIEPSPASFLDRDGPAWSFYQSSVERFGNDEFVAVAVEGTHPWDPAALEDVRRITARIEHLPGVARVDSLATVPIIDATTDGSLRLDPALVDGRPLTPGEVVRIRALVGRDRIVPGNLMSSDGSVFAINVVFDRDQDAHDDGRSGRQAAVLATIERLLDGRRAWVSGVPVFEIEAAPQIRTEILTFVPLTVALIAAGLGVVFRSAVAPVASLLASGVATLLVLGVMGGVGADLTLVTMTLPSLWLAFGSTYAIHVLAAARGMTTPEALVEALRPVAAPVALSGVTTAAGFFALGSIRLDAIRGLGLFGGIGVLVVLGAALTVVPAIVSFRPLPAARQAGATAWQARTVDRLVGLAARRGRLVVAGWLIVAGISGAGITWLSVETDASRWWPPESHVRAHFEAIRDRLSGVGPMNVVIDAPPGRTVTEPMVMERIDALAAHLEALPEVGRAISLADLLRQLGGGDQVLPASQALIEQYLLLLESTDRVWDLVTPDRTSASIVLRVDTNGSRALVELARKAETWWRGQGLRDFDARCTGLMFEYARIEEAIAWGQIQGLTLALLAIGVVLLIVFRSPYLVGVALVPNVLPLVILYGVMGWLRIPLDGATACVGSVALGIAVDDTVHLTSHFRDARSGGMLPVAALGKSLHRVLAPVVYTTGLVSLGFAVLALSSFLPIRNLGIIFVSVLAICLLADTILLPALLLSDRRRTAQTTR